jgi:DNA polymerase-4
MAAKIASDLKKPDGFVEVPQEGLLDFLRPLETRRLWGLGPKTAAALAGIGVNTIGDLAGRDPAEMERMFGANGLHLLRLANGIDDRGVVTEGEAKSISNEHTFGTDTRDGARLESTMMRLSEKVSARLRAGGLQCRTVTLKIRLKGFRTYTRSATMRSATNFADILYKEAKGLYNDFLRGAGFGVPIRLVGIKAHNLSSAAGSGDLFTGEGDRKMERLYGAIDRIRGRFGEGCICHAAGIPRKKHEKPEQA